MTKICKRNKRLCPINKHYIATKNDDVVQINKKEFLFKNMTRAKAPT